MVDRLALQEFFLQAFNFNFLDKQWRENKNLRSPERKAWNNNEQSRIQTRIYEESRA